MSRIFWSAVAALFLLFVLRETGLLGEGYLAHWADYVLGLACSLACPLFFLSLYLAPGLFQDLTGGWSAWWRRFQSQRRTVEDLEHKIARLGKAHHMAQLGGIYLQQGRHAKAAELLEKALAAEPDVIDTRYRLGVCRFEQGDYPAALELLKTVHEIRPEHDYGMAYLRLAQAYQRTGEPACAAEIYDTLLRYYPGQPEGSYCFALLKSEMGENEEARKLMEDMIFSVRHSPAFQRRRNRHWVLKGKYWLWRH